MDAHTVLRWMFVAPLAVPALLFLCMKLLYVKSREDEEKTLVETKTSDDGPVSVAYANSPRTTSMKRSSSFSAPIVEDVDLEEPSFLSSPATPMTITNHTMHDDHDDDDDDGDDAVWAPPVQSLIHCQQGAFKLPTFVTSAPTENADDNRLEQTTRTVMQGRAPPLPLLPTGVSTEIGPEPFRKGVGESATVAAPSIMNLDLEVSAAAVADFDVLQSLGGLASHSSRVDFCDFPLLSVTDSFICCVMLDVSLDLPKVAMMTNGVFNKTSHTLSLKLPAGIGITLNSVGKLVVSGASNEHSAKMAARKVARFLRTKMGLQNIRFRNFRVIRVDARRSLGFPVDLSEAERSAVPLLLPRHEQQSNTLIYQHRGSASVVIDSSGRLLARNFPSAQEMEIAVAYLRQILGPYETSSPPKHKKTKI